MKIEDLTLKQIKEICRNRQLSVKRNGGSACEKCPIKDFCFSYFNGFKGELICPFSDWSSEDLEREVEE